MEQDQEVKELEQVEAVVVEAKEDTLVGVKAVVAGGVVLEQGLAVTACVLTAVKEPPIN